jgi:hypothetical protein
MYTFIGSCHCGNLQIRFETGFNHTDLPLRACQCAFCRAHGAVTATDPDGRVLISVNDSARVSHYRFGLGITDCLICADCGVFMAAVMEIDNAFYASINSNVLDIRAKLSSQPQPVDYSDETAEQRSTRRKKNWTPAAFIGTLA